MLSKVTQFIIRITKYTPAVTKVEEWTKADTGVGAAIAAGSQALKGNWALFVQAAVTSTPTNIQLGVIPQECAGIIDTLGRQNTPASVVKISASPTRFLIPVIRPELKALLLL